MNIAAPGLTDQGGLHDGPLPLATTLERQPDACCRGGTGRRSQRRIQRKVLVDWLVADAAQAANALYQARADRPSWRSAGQTEFLAMLVVKRSAQF